MKKLTEEIISTPPKFILGADEDKRDLYIIHTQFPLAVIYVYPSAPAKIFMVECQIDQEKAMEDMDKETLDILQQVLYDAGDFYRKKTGNALDNN